MSPDEQNPRIVQPGDVEFDGAGTVKPDTLDVRVAQGAPDAARSLQTDADQMEFLDGFAGSLLGQVYGHLDDRGSFCNRQEVTTVHIRPLLGSAITLIRENKRGYVDARIELQPAAIKPDVVANIVKRLYGPEIATLGFFEEAGITTGNWDWTALVRYFPEFNELIKLGGKVIPITKCAYETILALPVGARPFFTGLTREMHPETSADHQPQFYKPWSLRDILVHARKVGEVEKTKMYADMVLGDKP